MFSMREAIRTMGRGTERQSQRTGVRAIIEIHTGAPEMQEPGIDSSDFLTGKKDLSEKRFLVQKCAYNMNGK